MIDLTPWKTFRVKYTGMPAIVHFTGPADIAIDVDSLLQIYRTERKSIWGLKVYVVVPGIPLFPYWRMPYCGVPLYIHSYSYNRLSYKYLFIFFFSVWNCEQKDYTFVYGYESTVLPLYKGLEGTSQICLLYWRFIILKVHTYEQK